MEELEKYRRMWDGSETGWKLIQYDSRVYLVEFDFDKCGPNHREFQSILQFVGSRENETEEQAWERLRGCTGIGMAAPLGPTRMKLLRQHESENDLRLTVTPIEPTDYLVLTPDGFHCNWFIRPELRLLVVARMLKSGADVVRGRLD